MRAPFLITVAGCLAVPAILPGQVGAYSMVDVGTRVRVAVMESPMRSPYARVGRLRRITGTVVEIAPDTIRLEVSAAEPRVEIPRILIYMVERSLGRGRAESAQDAALAGLGVAAVSMGFFREDIRAVLAGGGFAIGAVVGAVRPYERWEQAWLPD